MQTQPISHILPPGAQAALGGPPVRPPVMPAQPPAAAPPPPFPFEEALQQLRADLDALTTTVAQLAATLSQKKSKPAPATAPAPVED